jgi:hypothetical protein
MEKLQNYENEKELQTIRLDKFLEIVNEKNKLLKEKLSFVRKPIRTEVLDSLRFLAYKTTLQKFIEYSDKLSDVLIFYKSENGEYYEMFVFQKLKGEYAYGEYKKVRCHDLSDQSGNIILGTSERVKKKYFAAEIELSKEDIMNIFLTIEGILSNRKQENSIMDQKGTAKDFVKACTDGNIINRTDFWNLIELIDKSALSRGDEEKAAARLIQALEKLSEPELRSFDSHLEEVLSDIDGDEYAENAGTSGNSDDGFRYLRQFVVAQGQEFYEKVKNKPTSIPNSDDCWFEYLDLIAPEVWAKKTGRDQKEWYK